MRYDAASVASFFDAYGEREWTRFEDGRTSPTSLAVRTHHLRVPAPRGEIAAAPSAGPIDIGPPGPAALDAGSHVPAVLRR